MTSKYDYLCPHCNKVDPNVKTGFVVPESPLRTCPHCHKEYAFPHAIEWSIASPKQKFIFCYISNYRFLFLFEIAMDLMKPDYGWALLTTAAWLILCPLYLIFMYSDEFKRSRKRTEGNYQYLKKLAELGYKFDDRYNPYS